MGSNPARGMYVHVSLYCIGTSLLMGQLRIQEVLLNFLGIISESILKQNLLLDCAFKLLLIEMINYDFLCSERNKQAIVYDIIQASALSEKEPC
jgi:hypothetical protein